MSEINDMMKAHRARLEPTRMKFALNVLKHLGYEITSQNDSELRFVYDGHEVKLFPYTGWHTGKSITDGRGINKLMKQIKRRYYITVHDNKYEMELKQSDCPGYFLYKLIPTALGSEPKIIYISPNREDHWLFGKPMEGKQVHRSKILYSHS